MKSKNKEYIYKKIFTGNGENYLNIEYKKLKALTPYEKNTKKHDKTQIANVAESIRQYGFVQPIVVDKNDVIVIGHCRYEASKKLKLETVPCVCVEKAN